MKDKLKVTCSVVISIAIVYLLFFFSIKVHAFSPSFYQSMNEKHQISESMDISMKDYQSSIETLLEYIEGKRGDIIVEIEYRGKQQPAFNERETMHMVDVRDLYQNAARLAFVLGLIAALLLVYLYVTSKQTMLTLLTMNFVRVSIIFGVLLLFIVLYAWIDFESFWTRFHTTFFSNDLWLLDARVDRMIQMLPQEVFFALVFRIVATFALLYVLFLTFSIWYIKIRKKRSLLELFL